MRFGTRVLTDAGTGFVVADSDGDYVLLDSGRRVPVVQVVQVMSSGTPAKASSRPAKLVPTSVPHLSLVK